MSIRTGESVGTSLGRQTISIRAFVCEISFVRPRSEMAIYSLDPDRVPECGDHWTWVDGNNCEGE